MLRVEQQHERFSGLFGRVRAHHFNYGPRGVRREGIWGVIDVGAGARLEVGAEVMGHGHIQPIFKNQIVIGAQEVYHMKDGRPVSVKLEQINGLSQLGSGVGLIKQDRDEIGYLFFGQVVAIGQAPLKKPKK